MSIFNLEGSKNKFLKKLLLLRLIIMGENITKFSSAEEDIVFRLKLEKIISSISSKFVGISDIDDAIATTLGDIGKLSGASRSYLFLFNEDETIMNNTYEWCDEGVNSQMGNLKNLPIDMAPWWMKKLRNNETIHITDVSKLPVEAQAEKEMLESQDIKSLLVLPLYIGKELKGFIGFNNVVEAGNWDDSDIMLLRLSSEILGNAIERKKKEDELNEANTIINRSPVVVFTWKNAKGWPVEYVSENVEKLLGFTEEDFTSGKVDYAKCIHPNDLRRVTQEVETFSKEKGREEFTHEAYRLITKDDQEKIVNDWTFIVRNRKGKITHYKGIIEDITKRKKAEGEIKKEKERLKQYLDISKVIFALVETDENIAMINKKGCETFGYEEKELVGKNWFDILVPKRVRKEIREVFNKLMAGDIKPVEYYENPLITKDGVEKTISFHNSLVRNSEGKITGVLFSAEDITERKKAEGELKQKSEQQEVLLSSIPAFVYYKDTTSRLIAANKAFAEMVNFPVDQLAGKTAYDLFPKEQAEHFHTDDKKIMDSGRPTMNIEEEFTDAEGKTRWASTSKIPYFDAKGQVTGMVGITNDITRQKHVEEEINRAKNHLQNVIDATSEVIVAFDENNRVITWNKTAERITGYTQKQVVGKHIKKLKMFDNSQVVIDAIKNLRKGHKPLTNEIVLNTKEGSKKIIKLSYSIIKSGNKKPAGVLISGIDVTYDMDHHGKILKGNSYLISDRSNKSVITLFVGLARFDYEGLFITRSNSEMIKSMIHSANIQVELLSQDKLGGLGNIKDLEELESKIKDFSSKHKDSVILLDRIDYLTTNFSFEEFMKSMYQINNIISANNSILLLHLNPSIIDARQLAIIEDELHRLPGQKIEDVQLDDELFGILKFILRENQLNTLVTFSQISQQFSIVRETVRKRLRSLENKELIVINKQGRKKILYVSEKGKTLLYKRKVI